MTAEREEFILVLRPEPAHDGEPPADVRLRAALKVLLRAFKLRCVECRSVGIDQNAATETEF